MIGFETDNFICSTTIRIFNLIITVNLNKMLMRYVWLNTM